MAHKISKADALEKLARERAHPEDCLMCEVMAHPHDNLVLYRDKQITAFLSKYPRTWGHVVIATNAHLTSVSEIPVADYTHCFELARQFAAKQELALKPVNTYIASIGAADNLLNTCPHFHVHVLPIYERTTKPAAVFTWDHGVYDGSATEWAELKKALSLN